MFSGNNTTQIAVNYQNQTEVLYNKASALPVGRYNAQLFFLLILAR